MFRIGPKGRGTRLALALVAGGLLLWRADAGLAQEPVDQPTMTDAAPPSAADDIADVFSKVSDQILEDCIFDLSEEQVEVQSALIQSYVQQGATSAVARRLAATQIQPPKPSAKCEAIKRAPEDAPPEPPADWATTTQPVPPKPSIAALPKPPVETVPPPPVSLAGKEGLARWDCAPGVDFVTIHLNGYERKLTGGEICSPYEDIVHEVPPSTQTFRLGYTIATGRLFVVSDDPQLNGRTIAWGLSGRDVCRNNPDPDCFAAKTVGPLPPGEYSFAADKAQRVSFGPRTKRSVVGVYLRKLWN